MEWQGRASFDQFCNWENPEAGIKRCSKSNFSPKKGQAEQNSVYAALKTDIQQALLQLDKQLKFQQKKPKSASRDLESLRIKLNEVNDKAQRYVNEYTVAREELLDAQQELSRAQQRIRRLEEKTGESVNVVSIGSVKDKTKWHC